MPEAAELRVFPAAELAARAAAEVAGLISAAVRERGAATIALAGGTTPRKLHTELVSHGELAWGRVSVYFGDERSVPPDHPDSNFRMAKESLFDHVPVPAAQVHRMRAELGDREAAAREYEALLPDVLDLLVLGIGEDGHTASLFPGAAALDEVTRRVLPVVGPKPPPERLTVTSPVIAAARTCLMLAVGAGKAEAVARALEGPWDPKQTPAQLARRGVWYLDEAAAALLSRRAR